MSSLTLLVSELQALATETRRRYPDVREAADKAIAVLRANSGAEGFSLSVEGPYSDELLRPVFLGCVSKNVKVISLSLGALQRLIALKSVPQRALPHVLGTMGEVMSQGVDIQLRILQVLLSLVTNFLNMHGMVLGDALLLCFRLQESRIAVVSSTAAATLRQLVMFIFEKVVIDTAPAPAEELQSVRLPDGTVAQLKPSELDAYCVFEDLCLLANMEPPRSLRLESLPKTFSLELIESVLTNYHGLFHQRPEILLLLRHHLSPLLLKSLSEKAAFPLSLRSTRVVFILLKQFSDKLATESEVFAMMLIKLISGEETATSDGSRRPSWMRVLATEVIRGLCGDADLMRRYWQSYDSEADGSRVFASMITALKRLVTERPGLLGTSQQMQGLGVQESNKLEHVAGMVANAATTTVSGALGIHSTAPGLSLESCMMKLQCIDQLDKADAPMIPEGYIYVLGLQCLVSIADGFASSVLPAFATFNPKLPNSGPTRLPSALDLDNSDPSNPLVAQLRVERRMIEDGWPGLLAALSFLMGTNLSDDLFSGTLAALQALTNVSGVLGLHTPRDAFLSSLSKLAIPARVVSKLDSWVEPVTPRGGSGMGVVDGIAALAGASVSTQPPSLSDRNIACLKVLIYSATFLGGSLGPSWFNVLEALQNADYVLTGKGTRLTTTHKLPSALLTASRQPTLSMDHIKSGQLLDRPMVLMDVEPEHVLAAIQGLFESTRDMDDVAFHHFAVALCKLSAEMIEMQVSADMDETNPDEAPGSPTVAFAHRRRMSGIQLTRTPRSGDFSVSKLGAISLLNIHRMIYADGEVAWNPITSHLVTILRHHLAPSSLRLQASQNLDNVLVVIPKASTGLEPEHIKQVQQRTLDVLALQVLTEGGSPTVADIRRMGLETLHQILQTGSHTLLVGWEVILEMLSSVCRPTTSAPMSARLVSQESLPNTPTVPTTPHTRGTPLLATFTEKPNVPLIRSAFQSLTLVCDTLVSLSSEQLKLCISTLGLFGRQLDTNIALTAAESLLWSVSDSIQMRRKDPQNEGQYNDLWMYLLAELLVLCTDARPEVRGGSIQTLFRTMQLYGLTLSLDMWHQCMWKIIFPLLDSLRNAASLLSPDGEQSTLSAWDESKILALQSIGTIFNDFLISKLIQLEDFDKVWDTFVQHVQTSVLEDSNSITTVAFRSIEKSLKSFREPAGINKNIADRSCESLWRSWETIGSQIALPNNRTPGHGRYTQDNLVALVDVVKTLRTLSKYAKSSEWTIERLESLAGILKAIMTYPCSDFRPDVDALTPLQSNILAIFESIDLLVPGAPSLLLGDLAHFVTLAFTSSSDLHELSTSPRVNDNIKVKKVTYIALCKRVMPLLAHLYSRFKNLADIYGNGTVEAVLTAYSIPIKLKYNCPAPSKFGADLPLWKLASTSFISVAKDCSPRISEMKDASDERVAKIWRKLLEVIEGALLADCSSAADDPIDEEFDHIFIAVIATHIAAYLGHPRIPDDIIVGFGQVLQEASKIHEITADSHGTPSNGDSIPHISEDKEQIDETNKLESGQVIATTVSTSILPRERFSYWCFDLLFLLCSDEANDQEVNRRRVAALCLQNLLSRVSQVLLSYCLDIELYGDMPFPRAREEEVLYVLNKLLSLKLWTGSLWASRSENPSNFSSNMPELTKSTDPQERARDLAYRSQRAHLFYCYNLLIRVATAAKSATAWLPEKLIVADPTVGSTESTQYVHYDSRKLATACLQVLGQEMGLPW
ncbi:hypothetical protein FRB91_006695 [Serendipita sp. 411]|nr:hypothetical protein FRB91_006695 [Serendipita sp. 411]